MNEKVDIEIAKRRIPVEMEGLTQLEILALAQLVGDMMGKISERNKTIGDSSKLAILTAMELAADLSKAKEAHETNLRVWENKLELMAQSLQAALEQSSDG